MLHLFYVLAVIGVLSREIACASNHEWHNVLIPRKVISLIALWAWQRFWP